MLKETCSQEKKDVRRLMKIVECEQQKPMSWHERLVVHPINSVCSILSRADTSGKNSCCRRGAYSSHTHTISKN